MKAKQSNNTTMFFIPDAQRAILYQGYGLVVWPFLSFFQGHHLLFSTLCDKFRTNATTVQVFAIQKLFFPIMLARFHVPVHI
jgi:hypothetical protein